MGDRCGTILKGLSSEGIDDDVSSFAFSVLMIL